MSQEHQEWVWNLMAKKLSGEATPEELRELELLLRSNPDLHYPMQTASTMWKLGTAEDRQAPEDAFTRHLERMQELKIDFEPQFVTTAPADIEKTDPSPRNRLKNRYRKIMIGSSIAAAILLGMFFALNYSFSHTAISSHPAGNVAKVDNEISTHNGSKTHLVMPDGTLVWLNAGSRLTYDRNFGAAYREVTLTGEAFFDVARNAERPFVIHTARIDVKVLGTRFNVKSYPTDRTTEATLIRGSIEVSIKDRPSEKIILKPNEKLVVSNDDSTLHRNVHGHHAVNGDESLVSIRKPTYETATGAIIETSWVDNKLVFQDEEFNELAARMERWYGMEIRFDNSRLEAWRFTGTFQNETIQQALEALKLTANFYYKIDGSKITIYEK